MEPDTNPQNVFPPDRKKTLVKILVSVIILVIVVISLVLYNNKKNNLSTQTPTTKQLPPGAILPEKSASLPVVFNSWPLEKDKILSNFSLNLPAPVDRQYTLVYQSSKSSSDVLNDYQKAFQDKKLIFRQQDNSSVDSKTKVKTFSQTLSTNLENENATLSVKVEVTDKTLVTLIYTKYLPSLKIKALGATATTFRQDIPKLTLPKNFPANFPQPTGAKIIQSYNMINAENGSVKEAGIVLTSAESLNSIKSFYANSLKAPAYIQIVSASKGDTDIKKTLVFTDKIGILSISITKGSNNTTIKISQSILVTTSSK